MIIVAGSPRSSGDEQNGTNIRVYWKNNGEPMVFSRIPAGTLSMCAAA